MTVCENSSFQAFRNEKSGKNAIFGAISYTCAHARIISNMTLVTKNNLKGLSGSLFRILPYLFALLLWVMLITQGSIFLKKVEDLSLFMFDWQYFKDAILIPGGLLGITGSFLTQFLFIPWLGSLIWVLLLLITYQQIGRAHV